MNTNINLFSKTIEESLLRFNTSSSLLTSYVDDPQFIKCDPNYINNFIQFTKVFQKINNDSPQFYFLAHLDNHCCLAHFLNDSENPLLQYLRINSQNNYQFKSYPEYYSYSNFSEDDGIYELPEYTSAYNAIYNKSGFFLPDFSNNEPKNSFIKIVQFKDQLSFAIFRLFSSLNGSFAGIGGISFSLNSFYDLLSKLRQPPYHFAILTTDDHVILTDNGISININSSNSSDLIFPSFPTFSGMNDLFWNNICNHLTHSINRTEEFTFNDSKYQIMSNNILFDNSIVLRLFLIGDVDSMRESALDTTTSIFLATFCAFLLSFSIGSFLLSKNHYRKKNQIAKQQLLSKKITEDCKYHFGPIHNSINTLRDLQLQNSLDTFLSRNLDEIITNLSEQKRYQFSIQHIQEITKPYNSEQSSLSDYESISDEEHLINYLIPSPPLTPETTPFPETIHNNSTPFSKWSYYTMNLLGPYPDLGSINFPWDAHFHNPDRMLIILFANIIKREELYFPEFDPDSLIEFAFEIVTQCTQDSIRVAHVMFMLYYLITGPFNNWINRKIDKLIIIISAFVHGSDCPPAFNTSDDSFSSSTEHFMDSDDSKTDLSYDFMSERGKKNDKSRKNSLNKIHSTEFAQRPVMPSIFRSSDFSEDNSSSPNLLKQNEIIFRDEKSILLCNIQHIFDIFHEFIPEPSSDENQTINDPKDKLLQQRLKNIKYFKESVQDILLSINERRQNELIGEFYVRAGSPSFNIFQNQDDLMLFMKSLLRLAILSPYWSPFDVMKKSTERMGNSIFSLQEAQNRRLIFLFHYEHASRVVAPWLDIFSKFGTLDEAVENFNNAFNYLQNEIEQNNYS